MAIKDAEALRWSSILDYWAAALTPGSHRMRVKVVS